MSALPVSPATPARRRTRNRTSPADASPGRPALRPLATPGRRMARLPFLIVLIVAFGVGMAGLLLLNTTLQNQEFEARRLERQATELTYVQDDLQSQLSTVSAPGSLAQKAYDAGMRPNVHPAFLVLPDGTVVGDAETSKGTEMKYLAPGSGDALTAQRTAAEAQAKARARASASASAGASPSTSPTTQPTSR